MSGHEGGPWEHLRLATRRVRREAVMAVVLAAFCLVPGTLLVGWGVGDGWGDRGAAPLALVAVVILAGAGLTVLLARRWVRPVTQRAVAAAAERRYGLAEGSLRGILELRGGLPPGSSMALFRRSEAEVASRLTGSTTGELAGDLGAWGRGRRNRLLAVGGGLVLLASVAGLATPDRARSGWTPILNPMEHLRGPVLPPLAVLPGNAEVARGAVLELVVEAPSRSRVTVEWRSAGAVPGARELEVTEGRAAGGVGPIEVPTRYRVRAPDGAETGWFEVTPVDPLLLADLRLKLIFPAYLGRDPEEVDGRNTPVVPVPTGTVIAATGTATRPLDRATFLAGGGSRSVAAVVTGREFRIEARAATPLAGRWELELRAAGGGEARLAVFDLDVVPDTPPRVRILAPRADTVLPASRRQPILAQVVDDHGIARAELVHRRVGARGDRGSLVRTPLPLGPGAESLLVRGVLDAADEPLVPGDVIEYHVAARDNSPGGQVGRSETFLLRLPSATELRERSRADAAELVRETRRLADRARETDRAARELSRRLAAGRPGRDAGSGGGATDGRSQDFQWTSRARQLADAREESQRELEELRGRLDHLRQVMAEAGLRDAELDRRLDRIADLHRELARDRAEQDADALRQASEDPDGHRLAAELQRMAEQQEQLRQRLEESLDLLRDAVLDQEMAVAAREAVEIAAEQEVVATAMREELGQGRQPPAAQDRASPDGSGSPAGPAGPEPGAHQDPGGEAGDQDGGEAGGQDGSEEGRQDGGGAAEARARQQEELAGRAARLTDLIQSLQQQLLQRGDDEGASQAGTAQQEGRAAEQSMQEAARQAREQQGDEAASSGMEAAGRMSAAARSLEQARGRREQETREQAQSAIREATQDALRLAEREEGLRQMMEQAEAGGEPGAGGGELLQQLQSEQMAVRQGLEQLGRNLSEAAGASGVLDQEVAQALARAMLDLERTLAGLGDGRSMPVQDAERTVQSLNRLAMALLHTEARSTHRRDPGLEEALRRLAELAREQGALNAGVGAFVPLDESGEARTAGLQELAAQQRGIARRVGEVSGLLGGREDGLGRMDELSAEAVAIALDLERGRLEPDVRARQHRLFHRLLDAGRTLEQEEYTEERVGRVAEVQEVPAPDELDAALLDLELRYPGPTAEQLRDLPPSYRRLVLEYFQRLNAGAGLGASDGSGSP
jgi:hypothetical protein